MAGSNAIGLLLTLVVGIYIRRVLGPEAIGQVGWALAVISYMAVLASPGLTTVAQRELARDHARGQSLFCLLITLQSLFALSTYGIVICIALLEPRGLTVSLLLAIQGLTIFASAWNTGWILQAHERMAAPSMVALLLNALQIPLFLALIHDTSDVYLYAILLLPIALLGALFNLYYSVRHSFIRLRGFRPTLVGASRLLRAAWPLALSQGAVLIYFNCDAIILGFTDGDATVGQYTTAYKLMLVTTAVTSALWNAYFPAFARSHESPAQAQALSMTYLRILCWMGFPMAAIGWATGRHAVALMYGPQFAQCGIYFEWLCLNIALMFVNYGIVSTLVPWGHSKLHFAITGVAASANLALNIIVIPLYGPYGAVATTLLSEAIVLTLGLVVRRRRKIFWHPLLPAILPALGSSTLVGLVLASLASRWQSFWWAEALVGILAIGMCALFFERARVRDFISELSDTTLSIRR
jgi:O-antigen/teichoic acid export membrane protein